MHRFLTKIGVKQQVERKVREEQKKATFASIKIIHKGLSFVNPDTKRTEVRGAPIAYVENLPDFVSQLLDRYKKAEMLKSHTFILHSLEKKNKKNRKRRKFYGNIWVKLIN